MGSVSSTGSFQASASQNPGLHVGEAENLLLRLDAGLALFAQFHDPVQLLDHVHRHDDLAQVVEQPGQVGLLRGLHADPLGQDAGDGGHGQGVLPQISGPALDDVEDRGGQDQPLDHLETQQDQGLAHGVDGPGEAVKSRVGQLQDLGREDLVLGDHPGDVVGRVLLGLDHAADLVQDIREGRQILDQFDLFFCFPGLWVHLAILLKTVPAQSSSGVPPGGLPEMLFTWKNINGRGSGGPHQKQGFIAATPR